VELYDDTGTAEAWRPTIGSLSPSIMEPGTLLTVNGSGFRGISEASSGAGQSSPTDFPLLGLLDVARGSWVPMRAGTFSRSSLTARMPDVLPGHYLLSVTVNAISTGVVLRVPDVTAPDTSLIVKPPNPFNLSSAWFLFTATEQTSRFECKLDEESFTPCVSPIVHEGLLEGSHAFQVRARDAAGNVDLTPASYEWTVDLTAPVTTLTSTPPDPSNSSRASFTFTASEPGARFECKLDAVAPFAPCTSPVEVAGLAEDSHLFKVRARDAAGNVDFSPVSYEWTVDLTAPVTTLLSKPPDPSTSPSASFTFTANEPVSRFECKLDAATSFTPCTSPVAFTALEEGRHIFHLRAMDMAGNEASRVFYPWTVDLTVPVITLASTPLDPSHSPSASFTFTSSELVARFECKLDAAAPFTPCTSPVEYVGLAEGRHTFHVRAVDAAGDVEPTLARFSWKVDAAPPGAPFILAPTPRARLTPLHPTFQGKAQPGSTVTLFVDGAVVGSTSADTSGRWSFTLASPLEDGPHSATATSGDGGGTSAHSSPVPFTIGSGEDPGSRGEDDLGSGVHGCGAGSADASLPSWGLGLLALLGVKLAAARRS